MTEPPNPFAAGPETYAPKSKAPLTDYDVALAAIKIGASPRTYNTHMGSVRNLKANWSDLTQCHAGLRHHIEDHVIFDCTQRALVGDKYSGQEREPTTDDEMRAKAWYSWMFGLQSPWRSITSTIRQTPDEIWEYGYVVEGVTKLPKNLLANMMIAFRFATEAPRELEHWYDLVYNHGIHPVLALVTVYTPGTGITPFNAQHMCFDLSMTDEGLVNMARGTPENLNVAAVSPINVVWQGTTLFRRDWAQNYPDWIAEPAGVEARARWGAAVYIPKLRSPEFLIPLLQAEQKRLGLESYKPEAA